MFRPCGLAFGPVQTLLRESLSNLGEPNLALKQTITQETRRKAGFFEFIGA